MDGELFTAFVRRGVLGFLLLIIGACFVGCLPRPLHAQNSGVVGVATKELQIFSAQASTASSGGTWQCNGSTVPIACPVFPDLGAAANFLSYCDTGFEGTIDLEWSPTGTAPFLVLAQASYSGVTDSLCHTLQVGGYFPNMRSTVTVTTGSLSAWYTASAAPIPLVSSGLGTNGPSSPINCDENAIQGVLTGATTSIGSVGPVNTGDTIVICSWSISFNGATSAGSVSLNWAGSAACSPTFPSWQIYTTASTPQTIVIPVSQRGPNLAHEYPCLVNSSGATVEVSISFASVHGL
jgi:hypothetical protein